MSEYWRNFKGDMWRNDVNVRDFIINNITVYEGDDSFLAQPTEATNKLWQQCMELTKKEKDAGGVLDMDTKIVSLIDSHEPGYLNKDLETIVGFQTDKPFKRSLQPFGGIKVAVAAAKNYGYDIDPSIIELFTKYRKTHNQGVFDVYTSEMKLARKSGIITGLPDAYGRGRIIGDYRRVALYGTAYLIEKKKASLLDNHVTMSEKRIRLREELAEQVKALQELENMAKSYGYDISRPANNAKEAIQWLYFGYLAAVKEQNGAAMSLGRTSTFLDIYIERDLQEGVITEQQAQEYIDHFIMKLRLVKFARTPDYNELFSGDPTWVTESIGGMSLEGKPLVTKSSFRYLHTLDNLGPAPEPNMTVLWSTKMPNNFKMYCAKMSAKTSSIQYENDDLMRQNSGDDYAIACCVSPMRIGKEMQFFGARANLAKALLYAINGGKDELLTKEGKNGETIPVQVAPKYETMTDEYLDYDIVMERFNQVLEWLAELYVNTLNVIHYMHDKYAYERIELALHDDDVHRFFATGIAGLSVVADSLSAIKFAKVKPVRNENGLAYDFEVTGDYPCYGNDDDRVDSIAVELVKTFMQKIQKHKTYREAQATMSILTITSNVVYGKKTGTTPDGRKKGSPFAPGANPMHGRDQNGAIASLNSVAKLPFTFAADGISNTFSVVPSALGKDELGQIVLDDALETNMTLEDLGLDIDMIKNLQADTDCGPNQACSIPNIDLEGDE